MNIYEYLSLSLSLYIYIYIFICRRSEMDASAARFPCVARLREVPRYCTVLRAQHIQTHVCVIPMYVCM